MPSTVNDLLKKAGLSLKGKVKWGEQVNSKKQGIYIVSLSDDPCQNNGLLLQAPISTPIVAKWIKKVETFKLDKELNPTAKQVAYRLSKFWLPDENILYIGMTTATLCGRINDYYNTTLGERKPHAGGHWIKTLLNLNNLSVYFSECSSPDNFEDILLNEFTCGVSDATRDKLFDPDHPFPFANLEYPKGTRKNHNIGKCKL